MLIGAGAASLLLLNGKIAGISGMADNALRGLFGEKGWRIAFLLGLVVPAAVFGLAPVDFAQGLPVLAISGLLVVSERAWAPDAPADMASAVSPTSPRDPWSRR